MKYRSERKITAGLIVLGLLAARFAAAAPGPMTGTPAGKTFSAGMASYQNAELERFFEAKKAVFENSWAAACAGMERYLRDYPAGKMKDEALYWLGRGLDRLARGEENIARVRELKTRAVETLERIIREFPESLWRDDARELRVAIAGELTALGVSSQRKIVEEAVRTQKKTDVDVRRSALNSLGELDPKTALPALCDFLAAEPDPGLRKDCLSILGRKFTREVTSVLENSARSDADEGVRREARYWLEKIRIRLIPFQLNYYCFETRLSDASQSGKAPEGGITAYSVAHGRTGGESAAKEGIRKIFAGGIVFTGSKVSSEGATDVFEIMKDGEILSRTAHLIGGFSVALDGGSIAKTRESISGRVFMNDMAAAFKVDPRNDVLLTARRGERMAILYLMMAPKNATALGEPAGGDYLSALTALFQSVGTMLENSSPAPVYHTTSRWSNAGLVIHSTLSSLPWSDGSRQDVFDYSLAKAEIPGSGGTWTLTGHLLLMDKERVLVGRMATLLKPDGQVAAEGDEIRVPLAEPSAFTKGRKPGPAPTAENPAAVESKPAVSFDLDGGCWIHSTRSRFRWAEMSADSVDFDQARAVMPGPGGSWILTGRLVLLKQRGLIMAREAVLMNAAGKNAAAGAILLVPIKNPEKFTIENTRGR
jgi:HEAT repeat protein